MDILITFALIATSLSDQVPWDCSFCEDGRRGRTLAAAAGVVDCGVGRRLCGAHETHARAHTRSCRHKAAHVTSLLSLPLLLRQMVMSLDFIAFWVLSVTVAWAVERAEGGAGGGGAPYPRRWWLSLQMPLLGSCAWLVDRCGERPSELMLKLLEGWRAMRQRIRNNRSIGSKRQ